MSLTRDIAATYRGPARVMRRLLAAGPRESSALAILMGACVIFFVSSWPRLAREAYINEEDLNALLGGALMAWLFIMPLVLYLLGFIVFGVLRAISARADAQVVRLALFWALLASSPLVLLWGLVAGFIGPGIERDLVGAIWFICFLWFWLSGTAETLRERAANGL
ncbi:YIP1 family protein [Rhodobacteraceae bacterium 63075]|nr:YIP1 family protein [Rhodobacteraceae bacterium 63075]